MIEMTAYSSTGPFWCFLGVTEMGGGLWFIPMNSPTMEAKMMLRSAQQPTWRRLLIGIRWVSRIPVFFFATQLGESQMMGQKTDKKTKIERSYMGYIWIYISCSTIPSLEEGLSAHNSDMLCWCGSGWAPCPEMRVAWPIKWGPNHGLPCQG